MKMKDLPFKTELTVTHWCRLEDRFLVIHDYMQFPRGAPARNLIAYSDDGAELWRAESISELPNDAYVNFVSETPLVVGNFAGHTVTIDSETGTVLETKFTK